MIHHMNKNWIFLVIGGVFLISLLWSREIIFSYTGDFSKILGLGALVIGYFFKRVTDRVSIKN